MPAGLDTRIGECGSSLSGGQRIALARALVRRPRLSVLDDATSSVDPEVENRIVERLRRADQPSTVVIVAYRQSTIALADDVVFLDTGRTRDTGTHAELLDRCPPYRDLVTAYDTASAGRSAARAIGGSP